MRLLIIPILLITFQDLNCKKARTINTTPCETDLSSGLIAYYPFTGNVNDESGNKKHGIPMNGLTYSSDANGKANSAANFDGIDDYITVKDSENYFAPSKMSISFQVNLRNAGARNMFLSRTAFTTASSVSWGINASDKICVTVAEPGSTLSPCGTWYHTTEYDLYSTTALQSNRWYHIAYIYNMGIEMIYIDGKLNAAQVNYFPSLLKCSLADFKIGGWWKNYIVSIHG